jgi:hypothetical protein
VRNWNDSGAPSYQKMPWEHAVHQSESSVPYRVARAAVSRWFINGGPRSWWWSKECGGRGGRGHGFIAGDGDIHGQPDPEISAGLGRVCCGELGGRQLRLRHHSVEMAMTGLLAKRSHQAEGQSANMNMHEQTG